ncbi:hypothetical protein SAMN05216357_10527 [Porphyromonadaceae bacterium KH3CP3RA]|nr:hypothetical protein SAMN05216357_10527 [Porphyromonadaceae bacterium KH3CP3RA]
MIFEHLIEENRESFTGKVKEISPYLRIDSNWLMLVMWFERDGWNRSNVFMEAVSFNYLPIKLISHIYEDFLTNRCLVDEINSA